MSRFVVSKQRLSHQHHVLLLLLLLLLISDTTVVVVALAEVQQTNECEVGTDGSCLDQENANGIGTGTSTASSSISPDPDGTIENYDDANCDDGNEKCKEWADSGECTANPNYMLYKCQRSCKTCNMDGHKLSILADYRIRLHAVGGDERLLESPFGVTQVTAGLDSIKVQEIQTRMENYMTNVVQKDKKYEAVKLKCKNTLPDCIKLKIAGQCSMNEKKCAPVCETCEVLDFKHRCPIDESIPPALTPGDLNRLFERIVSDEYYQQYQPTVLSMPATNKVTNTSLSAADDGRIIPDGPWLIVLENFLTPDECRHIRELGHVQGYLPSADVGAQDLEGKITSKYSQGRTSTNAWCTPYSCAPDPIVMEVTSRMSNVTGIPQDNHEYLQLLRYETGQHYGRHHDYADYHLERQYGPRVLTFFLYLNTVEQGGGTDFPVLNITVQPKQGRAVLWPSVLNDRPMERDERTDHAALPVEQGIKYGANAWIHQKDFRFPYNNGCV